MGAVFVFHAADSKVGATMTAQCSAERMAELLPSKRVVFVSLNDSPNSVYAPACPNSVDDFRLQLESGLKPDLRALAASKKKQNLYFISGIRDITAERSYFPHMSERLLKELAQSFDVVIADSGSRPDSGLALGALICEGTKYLVLSQSEGALRGYERSAYIYEKLGVSFRRAVICGFSKRALYDGGYIAKRLGRDEGDFYRISFSPFGRQAEAERKSLTELRDEKAGRDIAELAEDMLFSMGLSEKEEARGKKYGKLLFG